MKILHFSDLHLGHETYGRVDEKSGLNTRLLDFLRSFDYIVNYTLDNKIDLVLFAGDAYKTRDPNPTYQREFAKRIKKIASKIPVVLITGNHDIPPSFGKADTLEIFPALEVPNVYVFSKPIVQEIPIPNSQLPITILALPWLSKSILLNEEERKLPQDKTLKLLEKKICQIYQDLLKKLNPKKSIIALVHQTLAGAVFPSGKEVYIGNDPIIPISVLADPRISYIAVGHIHKFQVLNENPPVIYPGSIERIDFGEEDEEKGFVVAEINKNKKTKWQFIKTPARKFKTILIKISKTEKSPNRYVLNQIKKEDIKDAVIRIQIEGSEMSLSQIIERDLKEATKDAYFLTSLIKKSEEKAKTIELSPEELGPIQWLEKYLRFKQFKKDEAELIKEKALEIFEEIT